MLEHLHLQLKHLSIQCKISCICNSGQVSWPKFCLEREWYFIRLSLLYYVYLRKTKNSTLRLNIRYTSHCIYLWCRTIGWIWNDKNRDWLTPCPASYDACHRLLCLCQMLLLTNLWLKSYYAQLYRTNNDHETIGSFWFLLECVILKKIKYWNSIIMNLQLTHQYVYMYILSLENLKALTKNVQFNYQHVRSSRIAIVHKGTYHYWKRNNRSTSILNNRMITKLSTWKRIVLFTAYKNTRQVININEALLANKIDKQCIKLQH